MAVYEPSDDSYFFAEFLQDYFLKNAPKGYPLTAKVSNYLDMGTGSGILSETALKFINKNNILAIDIDKDSCEFVAKKGFQVLQSNLFSKLSKFNKFDLITFNAPYLPEDPDNFEPADSKRITTGGEKGDEISLKFIKQAKQHLTKYGKIFLLISSLTPTERINKFKPKIVARKKIFMEELLILEFN